MLHQIHAVSPAAADVSQPPEAESAAAHPVILPPALLTRTRELDAEHRAATGGPISRDTLRAQLRIGRDRASALVAAVRAEASAGTQGQLPQQAAA